MQYYLTVGEIKKACENNKYLLIRYKDNSLMGVNGKAILLAAERSGMPATDKTKYIGYTPCELDAYIQYKLPFMS